MKAGTVIAEYEHVIFDLDGVLILGDQPVPGAADAVSDLRDRGLGIGYATNNASRSSNEVADLLTGIGISAKASEVLTSAQAAAMVLRQRCQPGTRVLVVGSKALADEVSQVGLEPVAAAADRPQAVVQGYSAAVGWEALAEASVALRAGALWVATNVDRTLPSPRGPLPGNGALVAALVTALGRQPDVIVGKPAPNLFTLAAALAGDKRCLLVGDRLDTDIEGANRAGLDSLLVLTGVSTAADLLAAPAERRPTFVAFDLGGLDREPWFGGSDGSDTVEKLADRQGNWRVRLEGETLALSGGGSALNALWALCQKSWSRTRKTEPCSSSELPAPQVVARSGQASAVLRRLGLG